MEAIRVQVIIPFHQPLGATPDDIEHAYEVCYEPLLSAIERAEGTRVGVHFTGHLLDYLSRHREELMLRVKSLVRAGRIEVLGGLFYGGFPALLPEIDVRAQIEMTAEYWESMVGHAPTGFWVPELAWSAESPRMFADSGLEYGYVSATQLVPPSSVAESLVLLERGGQRIAGFVLDDELSRAITTSTVDEWADALIGKAISRDCVTSVWVRAEALGLTPGSHRWCHEHGWLDRWLAALGGGRCELATVLPSEAFAASRPARAAKLVERCPETSGAFGRDEAPVDFADFVLQFPEADALHRRMLRASDKLREAIATMEDEGLDAEWGSELATAQRAIFAAQAPDAYWRGRTPGFSDPRLRDAVMARIIQAESIMDRLVQGDEDWISAEEEDRDGDLIDEVFVCNRHLVAWVAPADGGRVRMLDDRAGGRSVLDVSTRREEPFFAAMASAPLRGDVTIPDGPPRTNEALPRLDHELPTIVERHERRGVREWLFDLGTSAGELFSGSAVDLMPATPEWEIANNAIDEEGDLTYSLAMQAKLAVGGVNPREVLFEKQLSVPIDGASLTMRYRADVQGQHGALLASELPLRVGAGPLRLLVNDNPTDAVQAEHHEVERLHLEAEDGSAVALEISPACDVWIDVVRSTVRDVEGYRAMTQGLVVVPVLRVDGAAEVTITLRLVPQQG